MQIIEEVVLDATNILRWIKEEHQMPSSPSQDYTPAITNCGTGTYINKRVEMTQPPQQGYCKEHHQVSCH
jgi:hypothetical protein